MKISQMGIDMIKSFEGFVFSAYKEVPSDKYYTIGYRHCGPDVNENDTISEELAGKYLFKDLEACESVINSSDWNVSLNQNKFDALTSFCYSLGTEEIKKLSKEKDDESIVRTMKKYISVDGKELPELVNRRAQEARLYDTENVYKCPENLLLKPADELAQKYLSGELEFKNDDHMKFCLGNKYGDVKDKVAKFERNIFRDNMKHLFKKGRKMICIWKRLSKLSNAFKDGDFEEVLKIIEESIDCIKGKEDEHKNEQEENESNSGTSGRADRDKLCQKCNPEKMNLEELVTATMTGKCNDGNKRRICLGKMYNSVQEKVNKIYELCKECNPYKMGFEELVTATIRGKCNNGNDRRLCLGEKYDSVQKEVNRRLSK